MGVSLIDEIKEDIRETLTGDDQFFTKGLYAFVLNGPDLKGPLGPLGYASFPLPVNPQDLTYSLPFASEITALQQGGVVSEEGGIVIGEISIDASMGFRLKRDRSISLGPGDGEFTGLMGALGLSNQDLSGQLHFWRLANRCFDAYSALKKDPESAAKTTMEFHSMRDDLHLQVIPREFSLHRSAGKERVTYRMTCRLAVVGPAVAALIVAPSPDKGLLSKIKDTINQIRDTIQKAAAVIDDVTASLDEFRRTISSIVSIIDDIGSVINSFSNLIDGTKKFLDIPRQALVNLAELNESVAGVAAGRTGWPADAVQAFRDLSDQMDVLTVAGTTYFNQSWNDQVDRYNKLINQGPLATLEAGARFAIESTPGKGDTTFNVATVFGGGEKPGDARRAANVVEEGRIGGQDYHGFTELVVGQGDSIQSLAAKHLGDARRWLDLALVNDLRAPYITDRARVPNTLRVGDRIVIPVRAPQASPDTITTGAAQVGDSQAAKNLGEDFYMTGQSDGVLGWDIDAAGGGTDVRHVSGIDNFSQAILMRFKTEQGQNILYPAIGIPRAVGANGFRNKVADLRYQMRAQLLADKRVARLAGFQFTVENDRLILAADLQPVGFSSLRTISRTLT